MSFRLFSSQVALKVCKDYFVYSPERALLQELCHLPTCSSPTLPPALELAGARLAGMCLGTVGAVAPAAGGSMH